MKTKLVILVIIGLIIIPFTSYAEDFNNELLKAAENGNKEKIEQLLTQGAGTDTKDNQGRTPLMHAAVKGYVDIAQLLISKGADVNVKDKNGKTALDYAKKKNRTEIIKILKQAEGKD